jgi:chemotaxis response regulator CheB
MIPKSAKPRHLDIIAIGASAGGVEAISHLLERLPGEIDATVMVVLHRSPDQISVLHRILSHKTRLKVVVARGGESLRPGICFVSEPGRHLTIGPDLHVGLLADGFYRSHSIDALFSSLAHHAGARTIGVILSGLLKDGTFGLKAIKEAGGIALVQDPDEAAYPEMPQNAIKSGGAIDLVGPVDVLASEICRLVGRRPSHQRALA